MTELQKVGATQVISQAISTFEEMIQNKNFDLPETYSFKNAIQQSRFLLNKPIESGRHQGKTILDICTPQSVMQAVIEMAQKGLNPGKEQCYFIPYGNTCTLSISYQGKVAIAKREGEDIKDVYGYAVYQDDEFEIDFNIKNGTFHVSKYKPDVTKWDKDKLIGAFAVIIDSNDEIKFTEYMTMSQIRTAWNMGATKGQSPAHKNFPDQMAIKTVKSRAVKSFVNSSDDSDIVSYEEKTMKIVDSNLTKEIDTEANKLELDISYQEVPAIEETEEAIDTEIVENTITEEEQQSLLEDVPF